MAGTTTIQTSLSLRRIARIAQIDRMETRVQNIQLPTHRPPRLSPGQCRRSRPPLEFLHVVAVADGGSNLNTESDCMKTLRLTNQARWLGLFLALSASLSATAQTSNVSASAPSFTSATNAA